MVKSIYLVSPLQAVVFAIFQLVVDVEKLQNTVLPNMICILFRLWPGQRGTQRKKAHLRYSSCEDKKHKRTVKYLKLLNVILLADHFCSQNLQRLTLNISLNCKNLVDRWLVNAGRRNPVKYILRARRLFVYTLHLEGLGHDYNLSGFANRVEPLERVFIPRWNHQKKVANGQWR